MVTAEPADAFDGRVVIVTGAASGIGRACTQRFGSAGARLALCDRRGPELAAAVRELEADSEPIAHAIDVRDGDAVNGFAAAVRADHGRVDVLVNNAGGTFHSTFAGLSPKGEATLIAENFTQVTGVVRAVVPLMIEGGSIVNVTSIEAHQAAPGFAIYAAMKAAVANLTRTLALELAPQAIRVNAVAPDAIPTGGDHEVRAEMLAGDAGYDPALVPPLGYFGEPDDAAAAVAFLASDRARFVTGVSLPVDGGNWAAGGWRRQVATSYPGEA